MHTPALIFYPQEDPLKIKDLGKSHIVGIDFVDGVADVEENEALRLIDLGVAAEVPVQNSESSIQNSEEQTPDVQHSESSIQNSEEAATQLEDLFTANAGVKAILEFLSSHSELSVYALQLELAGQNRKSLITALEQMV